MGANDSSDIYSTDEKDILDFIAHGGTVGFWPTMPRRSKAYYRFGDALDTFEERAEGLVVNVTHPLRKAARWLDDRFGGGE